MTGYMATKNQMFYYKCRTKGCGVNKNAEDLHRSFLALLEELTIPLTPGIEHFLRKPTTAAFKRLNEKKTEDLDKMQMQIQELNKKLNRLEERFIEEEITKEMFLKYAQKAKDERLQIEQEIQRSKGKCSNLEKLIEAACGFASKLKPPWVLGEYQEKQKLQFMLFPDGIYYDKKKDTVRTERINSVFASFTQLARVWGKNKSGSNNLKIIPPALVGARRIKSNFIRGLKFIEEYIQTSEF